MSDRNHSRIRGDSKYPRQMEKKTEQKWMPARVQTTTKWMSTSSSKAPPSSCRSIQALKLVKEIERRSHAGLRDKFMNKLIVLWTMAGSRQWKGVWQPARTAQARLDLNDTCNRHSQSYFNYPSRKKKRWRPYEMSFDEGHWPLILAIHS